LDARPSSSEADGHGRQGIVSVVYSVIVLAMRFSLCYCRYSVVDIQLRMAASSDASGAKPTYKDYYGNFTAEVPGNFAPLYGMIHR
jgi:hypothetical protein